ncbi:MAG: TolC family protein [Blastochloris sp.]|nr:TolC family protein [Blastochloris sp.]
MSGGRESGIKKPLFMLGVLGWSVLSSLGAAETLKTMTPEEKLRQPDGPRWDGLTMKACYELALLRMESLGLSEQEVRIAQARYREAIGSILPSVRAVGEQYFFKDRGTDFGSPVAGGGFGSNDLTPRQARVNVRVPLFSGLRDVETARAARAEIEGNRQSLRRARQNLYLDVAESYYQTLSYEEDLQILANVREALNERVELLEQRVKLGKSRDSELLQARSALAQTKVDIERTKGLLAATREMLAFMIGVPVERWTLKDDAAPPPGSLELAEYLAQVTGRPDLLAAVQMERSARAQLSSAKGEHWGKLSFEGNYTFYDSDSQRDGDWSGFLSLEIPLFDGGSIEARVDQQRALFAQKKLDLSRLEREAERDVRTAFNQFNSSLAELARLKEAVETAKQNYQAQKSDYELRVVTNLDVLNALRDLFGIMREESNARTNLRVNLVKLYVAAGSSGMPGNLDQRHLLTHVPKI